MAEITPVFDETRKVFTIEYQPQDENGDPIGRPQKFEAPTERELLVKVANAHQSATALAYKERSNRKIVDLIDVDPAQPVIEFKGRSLTADELVRLSTDLKDPKHLSNALRLAIEAEFGAPIDVIRKTLQAAQLNDRIQAANLEVERFLATEPDYYPLDANKEALFKYLDREHLALTAKNLVVAYNKLKDGLVKRPAPVATSSTSAPAAAVPGNPGTPAAVISEPPSTPGNPGSPVTAQPSDPGAAAAERRTPSQSSSGLSRANATIAPANAASGPETLEITLADINKLSASEYAEKLRDPKFAAAVKKLFGEK